MRRIGSKQDNVAGSDFYQAFIDEFNKIAADNKKIAMDIVIDESDESEWIDDVDLQESLADALTEMVANEPDTVRAFYIKAGIAEEKVNEALQTMPDRVVADLIERATKVNHAERLDDETDVWLDHDGEFKVKIRKTDKFAGLKMRTERAKVAFEEYNLRKQK
jgi:hypothetical protein